MRNKRTPRPLVYICSRYSGDTAESAEKTWTYSRYAVERGTVPVTPHLLFPQFFIRSDATRAGNVYRYGAAGQMRTAVAVWQRGVEWDSKNKKEEVRYFTDDFKEDRPCN